MPQRASCTDAAAGPQVAVRALAALISHTWPRAAASQTFNQLDGLADLIEWANPRRLRLPPLPPPPPPPRATGPPNTHTRPSLIAPIQVTSPLSRGAIQYTWPLFWQSQGAGVVALSFFTHNTNTNNPGCQIKATRRTNNLPGSGCLYFISFNISEATTKRATT